VPIRIEYDKPDYEGVWVEFRDRGWRFKDRRRILSSFNDLETLEVVLGYITGWNMLDVDMKKVPFKPTATIGKGDETKEAPNLALFDDLDDVLIVPWVISAWFMARHKATEVPKES